MRKKKRGSVKDNCGNEIIVEGDKVSLRLNSENKKRELGVINTIEKSIYVKRNRRKHVMRKNNSYGFNYFLLKNATKFDTVILTDDVGSWEIPISYIMENGTFLNFKQVGFELQIFLSLNLLTDDMKIILEF